MKNKIMDIQKWKVKKRFSDKDIGLMCLISGLRQIEGNDFLIFQIVGKKNGKILLRNEQRVFEVDNKKVELLVYKYG